MKMIDIAVRQALLRCSVDRHAACEMCVTSL